jgi:hypothetical protein
LRFITKYTVIFTDTKICKILMGITVSPQVILKKLV